MHQERRRNNKEDQPERTKKSSVRNENPTTVTTTYSKLLFKFSVILSASAAVHLVLKSAADMRSSNYITCRLFGVGQSTTIHSVNRVQSA
jgi:hypothetical protein